MDEVLILYSFAAVLTTIAFVILYRESKKRQKAKKAAEAELLALAEAEKAEKDAPREKKDRAKSHGKRRRN